MNEDELMYLLCLCHDALAAMTEQYGCDDETSQILDDTEQLIGQINQEPHYAHVH